jgi:hypothetical protein
MLTCRLYCGYSSRKLFCEQGFFLFTFPHQAKYRKSDVGKTEDTCPNTRQEPSIASKPPK